MKFSEKMRLMIILKVSKNQGFTLSLEDTFFEKPQGVGRASSFRVKWIKKEEGFRKIWTRNNSVFRHFSRSVIIITSESCKHQYLLTLFGIYVTRVESDSHGESCFNLKIKWEIEKTIFDQGLQNLKQF